jgi:hypothetical protein
LLISKIVLDNSELFWALARPIRVELSPSQSNRPDEFGQLRENLRKCLISMIVWDNSERILSVRRKPPRHELRAGAKSIPDPSALIKSKRKLRQIAPNYG